MLKNNTNEVLKLVNEKRKITYVLIGGKAVDLIQDLTPVDTGLLKSSITYEQRGAKLVIGSNVEYSPAVELGTRTRKGVHMIENGILNNVREFEEIAQGVYND